MTVNQDNFDPEDARLSAYALEELDGEECAYVEKLIEANAEARAFVDELRATASSLEHDFAAEESDLALTRGQRALIRSRTRPRDTLRYLACAAAVAAGITAVVFALSVKGAREIRHEGGSRVLSDAAAGPTAKARIAYDDGTDGDLRATAGNTAKAKVSALQRSHPTAGTPGFKDAVHPAWRYWDRSFSESALNEIDVDLEGLTWELIPSELYSAITENAFRLATQDPLSTFSIDVDTASYANVRRHLNGGQLPPVDAVRIEELLNYFRYDYPKASGAAPFSNSATVATCPWAPSHKLVQVGLRARDIDMARRRSSNLVFLVDVSGSMDQPDKLPLLVRSMKMVVGELDQRDRVAIVVYAGASGLVLPSTTCDYKSVIVNALDALQAGGSTNGGAGIELAYSIAAQNKLSEGQNRVILCTDGDFNVGVTDQGSLVKLIEEKRKSGVFLSVLGFGTGNTKDSTMETLADKGNGNYAYIDTIAEARKVLVNEMGGTLFTVAKDVKIQVEFNPSRVQAWRLIGYENRLLAHQDFNDDTKDAGEIGAGHTVTALYEVVPVGVAFQVPGVDPLRYQEPTQTAPKASSDELVNLKLRYKAPDGDVSQFIETPIADTSAGWQEASADFKLAAAVASFGMVLRHSANVGAFTLQDVLNLAVQGIGEDVGGYRHEFVELVRKAHSIGR